MRCASLLSLTALTVLMAGCATVAPDPASSELASTGAPQPIDGHDWFFTADGTDAKLAYGVADSDDLKLGLECVQGTGRLDITASADDGPPRKSTSNRAETPNAIPPKPSLPGSTTAWS